MYKLSLNWNHLCFDSCKLGFDFRTYQLEFSAMEQKKKKTVIQAFDNETTKHVLRIHLPQVVAKDGYIGPQV